MFVFCSYPPRVWVKGRFVDLGFEKKQQDRAVHTRNAFLSCLLFLSDSLHCHLCQGSISGIPIFIFTKYPVISFVILLSHSTIWIRQGPWLHGVLHFWVKQYTSEIQCKTWHIVGAQNTKVQVCLFSSGWWLSQHLWVHIFFFGVGIKGS